MGPERIQYLFDKYQLGKLTLRERTELMNIIRNEKNVPEVNSFIDRVLAKADLYKHEETLLDPAIDKIILANIQQKTILETTEKENYKACAFSSNRVATLRCGDIVIYLRHKYLLYF